MSVKVIISLVLSLSLLAFVFLAVPQKDDVSSINNCEFLRIHIRANSNSEVDQDIKYVVKDEVVKYLTPHLSKAQNKASAMQIVKSVLPDLKIVVDNVLLQNGFAYTSDGRLLQENFPTRVYDDKTLPAGMYDSLIINLGSGLGNNWWCVVYPPLCFVNADNSNNVVYKSKLVEIINSFWRRVNVC